MQTERELFELIKETYPIHPSEAFVSETDAMLRQMARKIKRKRKLARFSLAASGIILCALASSWFFFFSGKEVISNTLSSLGDENTASIANKLEPSIFIYQTHNDESFMPEINVDNADEAFDKSKNITLVGERLSKKLNENKINTIHDTSDFIGNLKASGLRFPKAYELSREALSDALNHNKSINMVFDLHRDSRNKEDTTKTINGNDYARIVFVVSGATNNYKENMNFATKMHNKLEKKYPGLSRGVFLKSNGDTQNTYNQDLLDQSVLLEIGGVENTLEEEYRSTDVLAEIISEVIENK
ncbi:stage II sporulation protein P [Bacillus salipaludis]|uniref:Stage II sporulation protein P n=1 Tax=Bacillus salipaludis TaxID=2547811 RepID=A0ABW8RPC2_9BACI